MPLPEGGDRAAAQLDALAAITLAVERAALERRIEHPCNQSRHGLDGRRRAADGQAAAVRELRGRFESTGAEGGTGGGAEVAVGVGGDVAAMSALP